MKMTKVEGKEEHKEGKKETIKYNKGKTKRENEQKKEGNKGEKRRTQDFATLWGTLRTQGGR